jgi:putative phosphoesterase
MRIGVLSDSHGSLRRAEQAVSLMGKIDLLLHAGDFYRDGLHLGRIFQVETKAVVGNCDRGTQGPVEEILEVADHRILLTHGHLYGVKFGLMRLYYRALEVEAGIVVFGHTHVPMAEEVEGVYFLNPGSVAYPRVKGKYTCAVLEIAGPDYTAAIISLD